MNKFIKTRAARILSRANELGLTDKNGKPLDIRQVAELVAADEGYRNVHAFDADLADGAPVLRCDLPNRGGDNYTFVGDMDQQRGVYIRFGEYNVRVYMPYGDEGIATDIYMADMEDQASVSACYAFHSDGEDALCENLAVDIDDVAEWVGLHYQRNFDAEAPMARLSWIRRYAEAHADAKAESTVPAVDLPQMLTALEMVGYTVCEDSDQPGKFVWYAPSDACDISFDTQDDAVLAAWADAIQQVKSIVSLTDGQWDALTLEQQCGQLRAVLGDEQREPSEDPSDDDEFVCSVCGTRHDIEDSIQTPLGLICPQCEGSIEYTLARINQEGPFQSKDQIRDIADAVFENFDYGDRKVEAHNGWAWSGFGASQHLSKTVFLKWKDEPEENDSHSESFSVTVEDGRIVDFG